MKFMCSLEHAILDWMILFLVLFALEMEGQPVRSEIRFIVMGIFAIDSIVLITNPINGIAAEYVKKHGLIFESYTMRPRLLFIIHTVMCITMGVWVMIKLIAGCARTSRFYRGKYISFFLISIAISLLNNITAVTGNANHDIAKAFFGFGTIIIFFTTYNFFPEKLIRRLHEYIDDNISDATLIYDYKDNLLKMNVEAGKLFDGKNVDTVERLISLTGELEDKKKTVCKIENYSYEAYYNRVFDKKKRYVAATFIFRDVSDELRALEREHHAATFDPLTNSYNRLGFFEAVPDFFERNDKLCGYAIMVSGICDFKGINSLYGSEMGDRILKDIAEKFHEYHHKFPMIYGRTAEGKFTSIIPIDRINTMENVLGSFEVKENDELKVRVDMANGFVVIKDFDKSIDYYYEQALLALARCKRSSDITLLEYTDEMTEEHNRKMLLISSMREALNNGEFFIVLQPQVDIKNYEVTGAEALVRWNHPTLGRVSPGEFIPLFEGNGFITTLDRFVWNKAAATLRKLSEEEFYDGSISVNVSQIDINSIDVVSELCEIVENNGIPAKRLHVEITESACVDNREVLSATMQRLKDNGFVVEIDDFGSGYSSLNALMNLPFDVVKLDMEFMRANVTDGKSDIIVKSMTDMIHEIGADIIVEGVETEQNLESADFYGGDIIQGYYFSKPIPVEEFPSFVRKFRR